MCPVTRGSDEVSIWLQQQKNTIKINSYKIILKQVASEHLKL